MEIGSVEIAALIVGIVQTIKLLVNSENYTMPKRLTIGVAMGVGLVFYTLAELINGGYLSGSATDIAEMVVRVIGWVIAIPGLFSVARDELVANFGTYKR